MADGVVVRRLNAGDLRAYKALRDVMLEGHPEAFTSDAQTEGHRRADDYLPRLGLERPDDGQLVLGAWQGPKLLGAIGLERDMRSKVRHIGHVIGMMVSDAAQGRGIGRLLLDALIDEARGPTGLEMLTLTVTDGNARAMHLYERGGFARFGTLHRAIRVGDRYHDKIYMVKSL
jgi:RimJ/RimL family protein N-acetyltransferase